MLPNSIYNKNGNWWVGLHHKLNSKEEWIWVNGIEVGETTTLNWRPGTPNTPGYNLCARLRKQNGAEWALDDVECSSKYSFVCETIKGQYVNLSHLNVI